MSVRLKVSRIRMRALPRDQSSGKCFDKLIETVIYVCAGNALRLTHLQNMERCQVRDIEEVTTTYRGESVPAGPVFHFPCQVPLFLSVDVYKTMPL